MAKTARDLKKQLLQKADLPVQNNEETTEQLNGYCLHK